MGWRISVQDDWYLKDSGLPGHGNLLYDEASFDNRRHVLSLRAASPGFFGRRIRADLTGYSLYRRDRYYNPGKEPTLHRSDLIHRTGGRGIAALFTAFSFRTNQRFRLGAEWRGERFTPEDADPRVGTGFPRERDALAVTFEDRLTLFRERLALLASYRCQRWEDNFHGYNPYIPQPEPREETFVTEFRAPTFGARAEIAPFLSIQASRSHYARPPTLYELFGTNGDVRPNPDLVPEEGVTWDGGFRLRSSEKGHLSGRLEVSLFHSRRDSLIYFIQNSQRNFKAVNLEEATVRGLEIQVSGRAGSRLRVDLSFTSQDARHHGAVPQWDDKWLPYVSPREFSSRASLRVGRFTLRHEHLFFDRTYRDRANLEKDRAPAKHITNVGIQADFLGERIIADLDIRNVGDDKTSDSFGYPMPGRTVYLSVRFELRDS